MAITNVKHRQHGRSSSGSKKSSPCTRMKIYFIWTHAENYDMRMEQKEEQKKSGANSRSSKVARWISAGNICLSFPHTVCESFFISSTRLRCLWSCKQTENMGLRDKVPTAREPNSTTKPSGIETMQFAGLQHKKVQTWNLIWSNLKFHLEFSARPSNTSCCLLIFPQVFQQGKVQRSNLLQASVRWDFLLCAILCFINFLFRHSRPIDLTCNLRCTNKLDVCERWNFSCLPMSSGLIYCRKKMLANLLCLMSSSSRDFPLRTSLKVV